MVYSHLRGSVAPTERPKQHGKRQKRGISNALCHWPRFGVGTIPHVHGGCGAHLKQCRPAPRALQRLTPFTTDIPTLLSTPEKHEKHTTAVRPRRTRARTTAVNQKARAARSHANQCHGYAQPHRSRTTTPLPMRARWWVRGPHVADPRATIGCTRAGSENPPPSFASSSLPDSVASTGESKKAMEATEKWDCQRVVLVSTFWGPSLCTSVSRPARCR